VEGGDLTDAGSIPKPELNWREQHKGLMQIPGDQPG
jgi:hypothetical protein